MWEKALPFKRNKLFMKIFIWFYFWGSHRHVIAWLYSYIQVCLSAGKRGMVTLMEYNRMNEGGQNVKIQKKQHKAILLVQPERSHAKPKHRLYSTI